MLRHERCNQTIESGDPGACFAAPVHSGAAHIPGSQPRGSVATMARLDTSFLIGTHHAVFRRERLALPATLISERRRRGKVTLALGAAAALRRPERQGVSYW